jgi:RHS repeat-associated protein
MVSRSVDGQPPERYGWSAEDRLTDVLTAAGERWTYRYDAFGRRIEKQRWTEDGEAAERVEFTWSGDLLVEETQHFVDGSAFVTTWEYHPDDDRVVTQYEQGAELLLVVTDQADTPVELVTAQATVSRRRTSTLWGLDTAPATPLRFPGQYHDAETGLHYNRYRYYDPRLGRFLSQDPLGLEPAPNPVGYVDNPHAWIDPLGLTPQGCGAGAGPSTAPPRRSGRAPKPAMALEKEKVWDAQFGPGNQFAGGTGVSVELGPGIRTPGVYGSTPGANENLASGVLNANRFGGHEWKKGHLWNDNLGGPGVSQNLTPMSGVANAKFQGQVEKPLKDALDHARRVGEFEPSRSHWLGVEFTAQKVGQKFPNGSPAEQAIGDYIDVSAYWMKKSKTGGETEFLGPDEQVGLPPLPNGRFDPLTGAFTPHA